MERAEDLLRCHDPVGALERFEAALAQDPADVAALSGRIRTLWLLRRAGEARQALADALATHGRGAELLVAEGTVALGLRDDLIHLGIHAGTEARDDSAATAAFSAAVELDPGNERALRGLSAAHRLAGRPDDARTVLDTALRDSAPTPGLLVESAWCAFDAWELDAAFDALDTALRNWPDDLEAALARAYVLRQDDRLDEEHRLLETLGQHVVTPCPGLDVARGWNAFGQWTRQALDQVPVEGDESVTALLDESRNCFERALETVPGLPSALYGLDLLTGIAGLPEPDVPADPGTSALRALSLARVKAHQGLPAEALADYRLARSLDPHLLSARHGEISCLRILGRKREAREKAESALALCPCHPWMLLDVAQLESDEGRHERALRLYTRAGHHGTSGRAASLRELECADEAEELLHAELARQPRSPRLLVQYAHCAGDQGNYEEAIVRYDRALEIDPQNDSALEEKKLAQRVVKRRFGRLRPPHAPRQERTADDADRAALIAELLPDDTPPRLPGRLRTLARRQAAIATRGARILDVELNLSLSLAVVALAASWLLLDPLGDAATLLPSAALVFAELAVFVLMGSLFDSRLGGIGVTLTATVVGAGWLGVVLWRGHGHPVVPGLVLGLAISLASVVWWLAFAGYALSQLPQNVARSRLRSRDPFTHLVNDLIDLIDLLEYEPALADPSVRRQALDLLERIARGQERVLVEALGPQGRRSSIEESTGRAFRHHVAGIAAATRDLKRSVLSPGPETWPTLRALLSEVLSHTVHARWEQLPHRQPDPVGQVLRVRLLSALRSLLVLLIPPALAITLQRTDVLPSNIPLEIQVIAYIGWPAIVLLLWLDPTLAKKVDLLKTSADTLRSGFKK